MSDVIVTFTRDEAEVVRAILNDSAISFRHMVDQGDHNLEQRAADKLLLDDHSAHRAAMRAWSELDRRLEQAGSVSYE